MTGLGIEEPEYRPAKIDQLLGQAKPGEVLRNLLVIAHNSGRAWDAIQESIGRLFDYELLPPDSSGANIIVEYRSHRQGRALDIASAGSGFQQVLMLLAFLNTREGSVLLLDEPDAHLHLILQDTIYSELKAIAARQRSQLIIATHSEVIIDTVDPRELFVMFDQPRLLVTDAERESLKDALRILHQTDILLAKGSPGILYLEGHTDLDILREWARILKHPIFDLLETKLFWKPIVEELRLGGIGIKADEHYAALKLVRADLPGLMLLDRDNNPRVPETEITGSGLQRLRWKRYEIESYLVHPNALERFVEQQLGPTAAVQAKKDLAEALTKTFTAEFVADPFGSNPLVEAYLEQRKARTEVLPPLLQAASLPNFPYQRYREIAAVMQPEEVHPEVKEKLDLIQKAFRL